MSSSSLPIFLSLLFYLSLADNHTTIVITTTNPSPPPSPSPPPQKHNLTSSLMPGIAVVIAVLTAVFSLTLLLLLYVKHYKQRNGVVYVNHPQRFAISRYDYSGSGGGGRKNSGIDRSVIESLPVFRFGALSGHKDGLECAVCLARFEPSEVLRLLPKCKHAFHVECVDTWLDAHSTCPLCRYRVDPEDILLISDCNSWFELRLSESKSNNNHSNNIPGSNRFEYVSRISGRHSSAGERKSRFSKPETTSFRRSLDSKPGNNVPVLDRKDGMLMMMNRNRERFEHRIMISGNGDEERWSEVRASDLLYLRSEMMVINGGGRDVINEGRSVSELTSIERRRRWGGETRQRQVKEVISRWLAWSHRRGGGGGGGGSASAEFSVV